MVLQKLFDKYHPGRFKIEDSRSINGLLTYTPDIIDTDLNRVLEIKTARSPVITKEPRADHIEQLKAYMAFSGMLDGVVFYHLITKEQTELFTQWPVHITAKESEEIRRKWLNLAEKQELALKNKTPEILDKAADDQNKRWLCNGYCNYIKYCTAGQKAVDELIAERKANQKTKEYFLRLSKDDIAELESVLSSYLLGKKNSIITGVWRLLRWKLGKTN